MKKGQQTDPLFTSIIKLKAEAVSGVGVGFGASSPELSLDLEDPSSLEAVSVLGGRRRRG